MAVIRKMCNKRLVVLERNWDPQHTANENVKRYGLFGKPVKPNCHTTQQSSPKYIPKKKFPHKMLPTQMFTAALFIKAKKWKQPKCLSVDK